jgi:hypothetical protein
MRQRGRSLPWPMLTGLSAPDSMWPLSVLTEQPSLAAASAMVRSPSGTRSRGLRLRFGLLVGAEIGPLGYSSQSISRARGQGGTMLRIFWIRAMWSGSSSADYS